MGPFLGAGKLRNGIVHFAAPEFDTAAETLRFAFEVLDPMVWDFWNETFVDYCSNWDDVIISEGYLREQLDRLKIGLHPKTKKLIDKLEVYSQIE